MAQSQTIENHLDDDDDRARPPEHGNALVEFGTPAAAVPLGELTETDAARIAEALQRSRAENTRRAYASAWRVWQEWAGAHGHQPLPANTAGVAAYLAARAADGAARATLNTIRAAISATHRDRALPDPTDNQGIRQMLKGLRREAAGRGRGQAEPLTVEDVAVIIATAKRPRRTKRGMESPALARRRGAVDAAIAGLLFQGGLRRSEAAALTWDDVSPATDGDGLLIRIRHSKTDQEGERADIRFLKNGAAQAVWALRPPAPDAGELVLGGLNGQSVARRIAAAAKEAGIEKRISGHSGRVGLASELTARGASTTETMLAGGWKTARMVAHYSAGVAAEQGAVAKYL